MRILISLFAVSAIYCFPVVTMEPKKGSLTTFSDGSVRYQHNPNTHLLSTDIDSFTICDTSDSGIIVYTTIIVKIAPKDTPELHVIDNILFFNKVGSYRIYDAVGNLISEGDFIEGKAIWDGRNMNGRIVASSAYLVIAIDEKGRIARKMMGVKR